MPRIFWLVGPLALGLVLLNGYHKVFPEQDMPFVTEALPLPAAPTAETLVPRRLTIAAVGDVLLHGPLQRQAYQRDNGFQSLWSEVTPWLARADLTYANLEGPTARGMASGGREGPDPGLVFDNRVHTSYPLFNYHPQLLRDLQASGVDVVSTANNHALDRGSKGVDRTIDELEAVGLPFTGTRRTDGSGEWFTTTTTQGITVAWVACSFSTNGMPDPHRQVLDCYRDKDEVLSTIAALHARPDVAAVVATPHWGAEYVDKPLPQEKRLAQELANAGALLILGAHPHVPQPWEPLGTPDGRTSLVIYSLGNFVSNQFHRLHTRASLVLNVEIEAPLHGKARLVSAHYVPLEMRRTAQGLSVEPVLDGRGTPALAKHLQDLFGPWDSRLEFP